MVIQNVRPEIDGGRYPAKREIGDEVVVEADFVADGHDVVAGCLLYKHSSESTWQRVIFEPVVNDRWSARFNVTQLGRYQYAVRAWVDEFATWQRDLARRHEAGQDLSVEMLIGANLLAGAASRADGGLASSLSKAAATLRDDAISIEQRLEAALDPALRSAASGLPDEARTTDYERTLELLVEPVHARFSAWYEMFPRSCGPSGQHGTFADAERMLPYVADLGFDVLYLPPVHPIGETFRKGRNNTLTAEPGDPGSPWAIGNREGGHKAVHPELGTLEDFRRFVKAAESHGLRVALDIAFQASPDHPYVREHPEWFKQRPDGSIQYAENPPKKYQDIYPFDFNTPDWKGLWEELASIFFFWIEQGVRIFRVDNPHTKSLAFWEWCLGEITARHPDVLFLSEAFTRPKLMYSLAKKGFTQSYTYFTWRHSKHEFIEYLTELAHGEVAEFFRPNFWPNTPDILPQHLQVGGRPAFVSRLILAATLASNYGVYGPAYELMDYQHRPGSEEYLDNEKYELKDWNLEDPHSLAPLMRRLNSIRRGHPALQNLRSLRFHHTNNDQLLCYSKRSADGQDVILVVVNLDLYNTQSDVVGLDLDALGLWHDERYLVHDLLSDARYTWQGAANYVELHPHVMPAHIFAIHRSQRT